MGRTERRRGQLVHRMLELAGLEGTDLEARLGFAAERAAREARSEVTEAKALVPGLVRVLGVEAMVNCFKPKVGRTHLAEQEVCDADGRLVRMDRIVIDSDKVSVIEFKTGAEDPADHESQVRDYLQILSEAYPGIPVEALLVYVDVGTVRRFS